jgi:hypothetical protein
MRMAKCSNPANEQNGAHKVLGLAVGQEIWIRCKIQPGPFSDENLVTIESVNGPISGFIAADELREGPPRVRGIVHHIMKDSIEVWIRGSFFTTNGLTNVAPELATAA